MRQFKK
jgi:hypothetical protein